MANGNHLNGGSAADVLTGTVGSDFINGGSGKDTLFGLAGDDRLTGDSGDDNLDGGAGDDELDGGSGFDIARYSGAFGQYHITFGHKDFIVADVRSESLDGVDVVRKIEALEFSDRTIYLDGRNNAPIVVTDAFFTSEDTQLSISASALLANDSDFDSDAFTFVSARATSAHGALVTVAPDGTVQYDPTVSGVLQDLNTGATLVDTFSYTIVDARGATSTGSVSVTVSGLTDAPIVGVAEDGYISGATVFADADGDEVRDAGEASTTTNGSGAFTLVGGAGPLVLFGGTDISTGLPFEGVLRAPEGYTVITPLSTLISSLLDNGVPLAEAERKVLTAFAIDTSVVLASFDPIAETLTGNPAGAAAFTAGTVVLNTVIMAGALIAGASATTLAAVTDEVFDALAAQVNALPAGARLNLSDIGNVEDLITAAAPALARTLAAGAAQVIANVNDAVEADAQNTQGGGLLAELSEISMLAQGAVADSLDQAGVGTGNIADTVAAYTGDTLANAIADLVGEGGDVDGPGVNTNPQAEHDAFTGYEDTPFVFTIKSLLRNDRDFDGDAITFLSASQGSGTMQLFLEDGYGIIKSNNPAGYNFKYTIGTGDGRSGSGSVKVNFLPINDAPSGGELRPLRLSQGDPFAPFPAQGFFSDTDGNRLTGVKIPTLPTVNGLANPAAYSFTVDGVPITAGQFIPASLFPSVVFRPLSSGTMIISYQVQDDGGTANGGVDLDPTPNVWRFNVYNDGLPDVPNTHDFALTTNEDDPIEVDLPGLGHTGPRYLGNATFLIVTPPQHGVLTGSASHPLYTPDAEFSGTDSFVFRISNFRGTSTATVLLTVNNVNDAPLATDVFDAQVATIGPTFSFALPTGTFTDAEGDAITTYAASLASGAAFPAWLAFDAGTQTLSGTPGAGDAAAYLVRITATDVQGAAGNTLIPLIVLNGEQIIGTESDGTLTGTANSDYLAGLGGNDPLNGGAGNDLLIGGNGDDALDGGEGDDVLIGGAGNDSLMLAGNADVADGGAGNDAISVTFGENGHHTVRTGPDGDVITLLNVSAATLGIPGNLDRALVVSDFTPGEGENYDILNLDLILAAYLGWDGTSNMPGSSGLELVQFGLDTLLQIDNGAVLVRFENTLAAKFSDANFGGTLDPRRNAPVAAADTYATAVNTPLKIAAASLLANDADAQGDAMYPTLESQPSHGIVGVNGDGSFTYTPATDFVGEDTFTYTANDGSRSGNAATVTVAVSHAPVPQAVTRLMNEDGAAITGTVSATDIDGDALSYSLVTAPRFGAAIVTADGSYSYTPNANFTSVDTFAFRVTDVHGVTADGTVSVVVIPVDDPFQANASSVSTDELHPIAIRFGVTDPDHEHLTYSVTAPQHGVLAGQVVDQSATMFNTPPAITYTPALGYTGNDSFTFRVTDGIGRSSSAMVTVTIADVLTGTGDNDNMAGTGGDDLIAGMAGSDTLSGLAGADRFLFLSLIDAADTITDFTPNAGGDALDLSDLLVGYIPTISVPSQYARLLETGGNTEVYVDQDGQQGDFVLVATLEGVTGLLLGNMLSGGNLLLG